MSETVKTALHVMQEEHDVADCKINETPHNHPDTDCGHYVDAGPGTVDVPDLNTYTEDYGKRAIVAGVPDHNLDQDVNNGPGVQ